ncbi:MAG: DUF3467 domain-containing protein [Thermoguttaceae bacterium]|jgi:hypothetical protein
MVEPASPPGTAPQAPAQAQPQQAQIQVDDSKAVPLYTNFCRVTGTPEELIIDFGLNPQPFDVPTVPIAITQRIITNYFTAKRMLQALMMTVQRHEATFGVIETDVQRRVHRSAMQQAPQ